MPIIKRCCHKYVKFCTCAPDAPITCPLCSRPTSECPGFKQHCVDRDAGRPL